MASKDAEAAEREVVEEEEVEVPSTILRSQVERGSQEDAKIAFNSLLANGSVTLEEDPVEEEPEAAPLEAEEEEE